MIINGLGKINEASVPLPKELLSASPEEIRKWIEEEKKKHVTPVGNPVQPYPKYETTPFPRSKGLPPASNKG